MSIITTEQQLKMHVAPNEKFLSSKENDNLDVLIFAINDNYARIISMTVDIDDLKRRVEALEISQAIQDGRLDDHDLAIWEIDKTLLSLQEQIDLILQLPPDFEVTPIGVQFRLNYTSTGEKEITLERNGQSVDISDEKFTQVSIVVEGLTLKETMEVDDKQGNITIEIGDYHLDRANNKIIFSDSFYQDVFWSGTKFFVNILLATPLINAEPTYIVEKQNFFPDGIMNTFPVRFTFNPRVDYIKIIQDGIILDTPTDYILDYTNYTLVMDYVPEKGLDLRIEGYIQRII